MIKYNNEFKVYNLFRNLKDKYASFQNTYKDV